jgi:hypothetical protein
MLGSSGRSLRAPGFRVNAQLLIAGASLGRGAPPMRQAQHSKHAHLPVKRQGEHASLADLLGRLLNALAVEPDVPESDDLLSQRPALGQPDEEQEPVDSHFFLSFASSAKAWDCGAPR